ncbi:LON peptidase substrate-binding domain-containing protein [Marinitenerispora sediminis]|uniref:Peptidase S16 n=1 Tax=Marinitenerispora sediminis TaxID=1931232 RepID=A0A368T0Y9_9ACTN|nr:LON peptidase substrate-binding domain-containing protein [Marinitenerispora sediminis]RCV48552.1 peptidase S16 [Marinitenerispora sediminis]RCV53424.1 peptidase S16 [Marinitenerispora sediminis]RCV55825.1 peptidase S16 [Marinitenerispora sediminis]
MPHRLPLFPLGSVLFPGLSMPMRVFEDRYRHLMSDLLALPADEPRRFGVVGIELGHEVGASSTQQLSDVGCVAEVRTVRRHEDGRYDLLVEGTERFRVDAFVDPDSDHPYLRASATALPEEPGPDAERHAERVGRLFARYCQRLTGIGMPAEPPADFPSEPVALSYAVAAAVIVDQFDKQRLLEAEHAAARLRLAAELLRRENRVLTALPLLPGGPFLRREINLN